MVKITSVEGNRQLLDGGAMFGNAPRPVWERWIAPDERGRIPLACRTLLIEWNGKKLLCEAGIGAFFEPKLAERFGVQAPERHLLLENLAAHGHSPESIDYVILSHLHFDHAGGLLPTYLQRSQGQKDLVFPKALYVVGEQAWQRALHPHSRDRASFIPELTELLLKSGRLCRVGHDPLPKDLAERVEFIQTEGHTPGQLHTLLRGDQGRVFFCGDLVPGRPWVHIPITMGYDRFPERLIDEKLAIFDRALKENWLLFFTHDPEVAGCRLHQSAEGKFEPAEVQPTLDGMSI